MKKTMTILGVVVFVLFVGFILSYFILTSPNDKGEFSISDYSGKIGNANFQTEKTYDNITDYKSAALAGKTAISERFKSSEGSIFEWMGCDVRYDESCDTWYISIYRISPMVKGGAYDVIMKSDGTVLAIWGEK